MKLLNFTPKKTLLLAALTFCLFNSKLAQAQEFDGKDFWLGFLTTYVDPTLVYQLNIISDTAATVTIEVPRATTPYTFTVQLTPNVMYTHTMPFNAVSNIGKSHVKSNTGIHVTSNADIILYVGNNQDYSSDAATAIPTTALGKQYEVIAYSALSLTRSSTFVIVGTEDNTTISIRYNGWTALSNGGPKRYDKGATEVITLNRGEVYNVIAYTAIPLVPPEDVNNISSDLTGTRIVADKPVSVFGGNECAYAGECPFCDHLFEQVRPLKSWGYHYNIAPTYKLPVVTTDIIRFYATEDNTTISVSGQIPFTLNKYQSRQIEIGNAIYAESDKPIHVSQYLKGSTCNTPAAEIDPLMMDVIPQSQYAPKFLFGASSYARYARHYATIIVETGEEGNIRLNGAPVPFLAPGVVPIPSSGYSVGYVPLTGGQSYTLESLSGARMSVYAYGYGVEEAYGYTAGGKIVDLCYVQTKDTTVCYGEQALIHGLNINTFTGEEVADNNILWFANPTGGAAIYSGKNPTTNALFDTITLWAQVDNQTCLDERYPIIINVFPEVTASIDQDVSSCSGQPVDLEFTLTGLSNSFDVSYTDGSSTFNLNDVSSGVIALQQPLVTTTYTIVTVVDDSIPACDATITNASITVTVIETPQIQNFTRTCNLTETDFVVEFDVAFGDAGSYTVSGLPGSFDLAGTHFTSSSLLSGSSYSFKLYDTYGCDTVRVSGAYACNCFTGAGTMTNVTTREDFCNGETAIVSHNGDEALQSDDALTYYLHTSNAGFLGTIIDSSTTPQFNFNASKMTYGATYYISAGAANEYLATGYADRKDPCLSVSLGTPIVFYDAPIAQISGTKSICNGTSADLLFSILGQGPFNIQYSDGTTTYTANNINSGYKATVSPSTTTTYTLVSVQGNNGNTCVGLVSGSAEITVKATPTFDLSGAEGVCPGTTINLPAVITGTGPFNLTYTANSSTKTVNGYTIGDNIQVTPPTNTVYTPTMITDLGTGCQGSNSGTFTVTIVSMPVVQNLTENCMGDGTYTVSFDISSGSGNYFVTPSSGTITNGVFTSDPINSNVPYTFGTYDDNNCDTVFVSGAYDCCPLSVGNMNTATRSGCVGQTLTGVHNGNHSISSTEVLQFILFTDLNDPVGSMVGLFNTPSVTFNAGTMFADTVYYLKAVAAAKDAQGNVNFSDPCMEISTNMVEMRFNPLPIATISGDTTLCLGQTSLLPVTIANGPGPWNVVYNVGNNNVIHSNVPNISNIAIAPSVNSTYQLVSVTDLTTGCTNAATGQAAVLVDRPISSFKIENISKDEETKFISMSQNSGDLEWVMPDGVNYKGDSIFYFSFSELGVGTYEVCLIAYGESLSTCFTTSCNDVLIQSELNIFIPNSFSPNGDENNDEFMPEINGEDSKTFEMQIFNRWGELVFETKDQNVGWNGGFNNLGPTVKEGSYVYYVKVRPLDETETKTFTGHVILLK